MDDFLNSLNPQSGTAFPYLVLSVIDETAEPRVKGFRVMHWHEELQFIYVLDGRIIVRTLNTAEALCQGEGFFINKNVVHLVESDGSCRYYSFLFPAYFLYYYPSSPVQALTDELAADSAFECMAIRGRAEWEREALGMLRALTELEKSKDSPYYCAEALSSINSLWLSLLKNRKDAPSSALTAKSRRLRLFLSYLEEHYMEPITLGDIARSASVSKAGCLRVFKSVLGTTPFRYLSSLRLSKAEEMLSSTDLPVSEIALSTGFTDQSYFTKCFRKERGCAPSGYRRTLRESGKAPASSFPSSLV